MEVAVIGMACRFPGADNWRMFWENLVNGIESIHFFSDEELIKLGVPQSDLDRPDFVKAGTKLKGKELFDAAFFDYRPDEAKVMNPMHRVFHECIWEALEDAGYDPGRTEGSVGLYAGGGSDLNWRVYSMLTDIGREMDELTLHHLNNKDYLVSLLSYRLNLKGPAFTVNTACSTSLVAVNLACKSLLFGEVRMAVAGGVTIITEKQKGYYYREGMIPSSDGHCRAFDREATGCAGGEGAGVVVLKRLQDAIADGDHVYAIIKGSAVNADGNRKVGFTAPSVEGQVDCIRRALMMSGVEPETIGYVEAHGTGTRLGDPIELEALNIAFNRNKHHTCAIGSVKTNIGHLDTAAGIAGLIKATLCIYHRKIPPSLHYKAPNPEIDFAGGPFYVNNALREWEGRDGLPLRAGVSSFGIGGTNAHAILEESPPQTIALQVDPVRRSASAGRRYQLLTLSARTEGALIRYGEALEDLLRTPTGLDPGDIAYTLQVGRRHFAYRKSVAYRDREELLEWLEAGAWKEQVVHSETRKSGLVFMFPGQGAQYPGMGKDLYDDEPVFREIMDRGIAKLRELTGEDYSKILYPVEQYAGTGKDLGAQYAAASKLQDTRYTQPAVFLLEYALAKLLIFYGLTPAFLIGHSLGEYVAACISGVFSLEDGLKIVTTRATLMGGLMRGMMVSVQLPEQEACSWLREGISLAAVNSPGQTVLSGDATSMEGLIAIWEGLGIPYARLHTSHAFHSSMQDPILPAFRAELSKIAFHAPVYPFVSNVTGGLITEQEACSPDYWVRHLRNTVRCSAGLKTILSQPEEHIWLEVGPGHVLKDLLRQHAGQSASVCVNLLRSPKENEDDQRHLTGRLGQLWERGVGIDWKNYHKDTIRRRVSLPTYCFEPTPYVAVVDPLEHGLSIDRQSAPSPGGRSGDRSGDKPGGQLRAQSGDRSRAQSGGQSLQDWVWYPVWKSSLPLAAAVTEEKKVYLLFLKADPQMESLRLGLLQQGHEVITVGIGREGYEKNGKEQYYLDPVNKAHFERLFKDLQKEQLSVTDIVYGWGAAAEPSKIAWRPDNRPFHLAFFSLVHVIQAFLRTNKPQGTRIVLLTDGLYKVTGRETGSPIQSLGLGLLNVLQQEHAVKCRHIDMDGLESTGAALEELGDSSRQERDVAFRHGRRWLRTVQRNVLPIGAGKGRIREGGVYLITGGAGKLGFVLAGHLVRTYRAKLVITGRRSEQEVSERLDLLRGWGGEVVYYSVDVADRESLERMVRDAEARVGRIMGIIHAAGNVDRTDFEWCEELSYGKVLSMFAPKVAGIENLHALFRDRALEFAWMTSSLASVAGGLGYASYAAANLFMDHFVSSGGREMEGWKCVGLSEMLFTDEEAERERHGKRKALRPEEIAALFEWSLSLRETPLLWETIQDLPERIERAYEQKDEALPGGAPGVEAVIRSQRPSLRNAYVAPETRTEETLVGMLQDFFGIGKIGVTDDFFDLGGDSLKAMMLMNKIKKEFLVNITVKDLLESQNVRKMAAEIEEKLWMSDNGEKRFVSII